MVRVGPEEGSVLIIIPARSGSKGIPNKNLVHGPKLGGIPLVRRAMRASNVAAAKLGKTKVIVSTDHEPTLRYAEQYQAIGLQRPSHMARPLTSTETVLKHVLEHHTAEIICCVQLTSPLIEADDIVGVVKLVREGYDSAITATKTRAYIWNKGQLWNGPRGARQRRGARWIETGHAYAVRERHLRDDGMLVIGKVGFHEIPKKRWIDVDDLADLRIAEALLGVK